MNGFGVSDEDLQLARNIATIACAKYGDFDDAGYRIFMTRGIWNDHPAVQAAVEAIKYMKAHAGKPT